VEEISYEMVLSEQDIQELEKESAQEDARGLRLAVQKIKIPTGGSTYFDMGDGKPVNDLIGLIIDNYDTRTYFEKDFDGSENKPDCQSSDCIIGIDKDGFEKQCASCDLGKYKKGEKTKCSVRRKIYILLEGHELPHLILVPPTSMVSFKHYVELLQYNNNTTRTVLTRIWLKKETSKSGFPYAQLQFMMQRDLEGAEKANALLTAKKFRELTRQTYMATPEMEGEAGEAEFVPDEV